MRSISYKIALCAALTAALFAGADACGMSPKKKVLRIATYNVGVFHKSGSDSKAMVAKMMKEWNPDVISLNELDSCNRRSGVESYQIKEFAALLGGWDYCYGRAIPYKGGSYGIGQVTRYKNRMQPAKILQLSKGNDSEYRTLLVADYGDFVLCNTHLGLKREARLQQIKEIAEFVAMHYAGSAKPVFLCGDMNSTPLSSAMQALEKDWTVLSDTAPTIPSHAPAKCIDYIMLYKNAAQCVAVSSKVGTSFRNGDVAVASDHLPVFLEVILP